MKIAAHVLFELVLLLTTSSVADACMCGYSDPARAFVSADVIFTGKVIKITDTRETHVGRVLKESGTLELLKEPYWEKSVDRVRVVTLSVTESFKGTVGPTVQLTTARYDGGGNCGIDFKTGESYLVYAYKRLRESPTVAEEGHSSTEVRLKVEANKANERLPELVTSTCSRTRHSRWMEQDLKILRDILQKGRPAKSPETKPVRIIPNLLN